MGDVVDFADTRAFGIASLTASGGNTQRATGAAFVYAIRGKLYSRSAVSAAAMPTADGTTAEAFPAIPRNHGAVLVWGVNATGGITAHQGPVQEWDGTEFQNAPDWPAIPATVCPFAYMLLRVSNSAKRAGIVVGTDNWNATGFTQSSVVHVTTLPDRPQVS